MSWVTSVLASCDIHDSDVVDALNNWLARDAPPIVTQSSPIRRAALACACAAQLLLQDQEQAYFRLWMIRDGRAAQYAPEPPGMTPPGDARSPEDRPVRGLVR